MTMQTLSSGFSFVCVCVCSLVYFDTELEMKCSGKESTLRSV